jgi:DNA-binding NtrC family response regulator
MATILIAEDEPMVMSILKAVLVRDGHRIVDASSAQEAIAKSDAYAGLIELLITDHLLRGTRGQDLAEHILRARPALKVLHISGHTRSTVFENGDITPGAKFLQKPFKAHEISDVIRELLNLGTPQSVHA